MLTAPVVNTGSARNEPRAFCGCWTKKKLLSRQDQDYCECGQISGAACEWVWSPSEDSDSSLHLSNDGKKVTFHPFFSSGTAVVKGDMPFVHNYHYYWEVKVLSATYGTDIIIGVGTSNVDVNSAKFTFNPLVGGTGESYGLSYTGKLRHAGVERRATGFCRGTIVGVRLDMWRGTLEYYLNREPQGISFHDLRRHQALYPMISSTAAKSRMRLVCADSYKGSLLVDALRTLAASARQLCLPPGLTFAATTMFWLLLPTGGEFAESENIPVGNEAVSSNYIPLRGYGLIPVREDAFMLPTDSAEPPTALSSSSSSSSLSPSNDTFVDIVFSNTIYTPLPTQASFSPFLFE